MTDEFIPTTGAVRRRFAAGHPVGIYEGEEDFDRWLAAHNAGRNAALQERIADEITVEARGECTPEFTAGMLYAAGIVKRMTSG